MGLPHLSTVLDDLSRYIIASKLCTNLWAEDVTGKLKLAPKASGCDSAMVLHKPRLLSDHRPSDIGSQLAEYIMTRKIGQVRGAPSRQRTRGRSTVSTSP